MTQLFNFRNVLLKTTIEGNIIDGESDFIIVIPQKGILFLEVKGGIVGYKAKENQWISKRRDDQKTYKIKDPVKQAKNSRLRLWSLLKKQKIFLLMINF